MNKAPFAPLPLSEKSMKSLTPKKPSNTMKNNKETWKTILQIIGSIIASVITALSTTSCMGYGPF